MAGENRRARLLRLLQRHELLMKADREILYAVRVHQRVLRSAQRYMTAAGEMTVERWLYKDGATRRPRRQLSTSSSASSKGSGRPAWRVRRMDRAGALSLEGVQARAHWLLSRSAVGRPS